MNIIFSDNVHMLCLSFNVKKPKTTSKLSKIVVLIIIDGVL